MMQSDGIRLVAQFGPFTMVPEQAWKQARIAMIAVAKSYGFDVSIVPYSAEQEEEKYRAYKAWLQAEGAK